MTMKPSDVERRVIRPVKKGTVTGVPLTCQVQTTDIVVMLSYFVWYN